MAVAVTTASVLLDPLLFRTPPTANAGVDQSAAPDDTAVLDPGSASDPEGEELSPAWSAGSITSGSLALISDPAAIKPGF